MSSHDFTNPHPPREINDPQSLEEWYAEPCPFTWLGPRVRRNGDANRLRWVWQKEDA